MALDFSKLHDAIGKVADLAKAHAQTSASLSDTSALVAAQASDLAGVQAQVDDLGEQLLVALGTPAEVHGLAAVANALNVAPAPGVTVAPIVPVGSSPAVQVAAQIAQVAVSPVAPDAPVAPAAPAITLITAAPVTPVSAMAPSGQTFLPGDPRALKL